MALEQDIKVAHYYVNEDADKACIYSEYRKANLHISEDFDEYIGSFQINEGTVGTIATSGDEVLQILKDGPKELYVFSQNPFAIYQTKLKIAAVRTLNLDEYKAFFNWENKNTYYNSIDYNKIREALDNEAKSFWDSLYSKGLVPNRIDSLIVCYNWHANEGDNSYLNEENYEKTQQNIWETKIIYYAESFFKLFMDLDSKVKFDSIFLSNIYNWLNRDERELFVKYVKKYLAEHLKEDGKIAVYSPVKASNHMASITSDFDEFIEIKDSQKVAVYQRKK